MLFETSNEGGSVFGRFLDILGERTQKEMSQFCSLEEQLEPHSIFVEISYWPISIRSANVAIHPCLRSYRLDIETNQRQESGFLSLQDIYVGATSSGFYMTDQQGKTRIITRTGNLFNIQYAPTPLKFMRYVTFSQNQLIAPFSWGEIQGQAIFLPRVRFGKTVLAPAQWNLDAAPFFNKPLEICSLLFASWAAEWDLPENFLIARGDQQLLFNRLNPHHLNEILRKLKKGASLHLIENISGAWIEGKEGNHVCEICVPFVRNSLYTRKEPTIHPAAYHPLALHDRYKLPGSEWLFVKLYLNEEKISDFLVRYLHPLAVLLHEKRKINEWFIVRYRDPKAHLRLRLHLPNDERRFEILPLLEEYFRLWLETGLINDVTFANYEREIERYGGSTSIKAAETVFYHDTLATISVLRSSSTKQIRLDEPILHALCVVNFLKACELTTNEMLAILGQIKDLSGLQGYRAHKIQLTYLLNELNKDDQSDIQSELIPLRAAYASLSEGMRSFAVRARELGKEKLHAIYDSMLHMHCNRLGCLGKAEVRARLFARQTLEFQEKYKACSNMSHK